MYYTIQSKCQSIQELWDKHGFVFDAVYGPCDKKSAKEYANDMIEINKDSIDFSKPNPNTIISSFDDDNPDDYAGLIS